MTLGIVDSVMMVIIGFGLGAVVTCAMFDDGRMTGEEFIKRERKKKSLGISKLSDSELNNIENYIESFGFYDKKAKFSVFMEKNYVLRIEK